jgi:hypothetical protein
LGDYGFDFSIEFLKRRIKRMKGLAEARRLSDNYAYEVENLPEDAPEGVQEGLDEAA